MNLEKNTSTSSFPTKHWESVKVPKAVVASFSEGEETPKSFSLSAGNVETARLKCSALFWLTADPSHHAFQQLNTFHDT